MPLSAALEIQEQVSLKESDKVLVVGDGRLALLVAQTVALADCQLVVLGRHQHKLDILKKREGGQFVPPKAVTVTTDVESIDRGDVLFWCWMMVDLTDRR